MKIAYDFEAIETFSHHIFKIRGYLIRLDLEPTALWGVRPFSGKDVVIEGTTRCPGSVCDEEWGMTFRLTYERTGEPWGPIHRVALGDIKQLCVY